MGTRKGRRNVGETVTFAIVKMVSAGIKQCEVAAEFKLSKSAVLKIFKKFENKCSEIVKKRGEKIEDKCWSYTNSTTHFG